jgi:hypothetical protein
MRPTVEKTRDCRDNGKRRHVAFSERITSVAYQRKPHRIRLMPINSIRRTVH